MHDIDVIAIFHRYPEIAEFVASGGPARIESQELMLLKNAAKSLGLACDEVNGVRTRIFGRLEIERDKDEFGSDYAGKISRIDFLHEPDPEQGSKSYAIAVLSNINTYCESGLLIVSSEGQLSRNGPTENKLRSLNSPKIIEMFAKKGTLDRLMTLSEIWESDVVAKT